MTRRWTPRRFVTLRRVRVTACVVSLTLASTLAFGVGARKTVALTIDGTRYKASAKIGGEDIGDVSVKKDYTIYLDSYGYMI